VLVALEGGAKLIYQLITIGLGIAYSLNSICVPDDLLHTQCDGFQCTHWSRINDYYRSIVVLIQQATEERIPLIQHNSQKPYWCPELQELKKPPLMLIIYGNCVINLGLALLID